MKKLFAFSILSSSIFLSATPLKADWNHWAVKYFDISDTRGFGIYTVESDTGTETLRTTKCFEDPGELPPQRRLNQYFHLRHPMRFFL